MNVRLSVYKDWSSMSTLFIHTVHGVQLKLNLIAIKNCEKSKVTSSSCFLCKHTVCLYPLFTFFHFMTIKSTCNCCFITEQHFLNQLEDLRLLSFTPSREVCGQRISSHDDRYTHTPLINADTFWGDGPSAFNSFYLDRRQTERCSRRALGRQHVSSESWTEPLSYLWAFYFHLSPPAWISDSVPYSHLANSNCIHALFL